jgi:GT2 family glycosyltransferase
MKKIPAAVLILNWNGKGLLEACLKSWARADPKPQRLLVVDNGSTDDSLNMLKRKFPKIETLALKSNLGFAAGNNRGFDYLFKKGRKPQAVFICNNDTEIEPDMLGLLWRELKARPAWGIAGPKILFFGSRKIWFLGGSIRPFTGRPRQWEHAQEDAPAGAPFELPETGFVTGCGLLIRSPLLRRLKGFDEAFWAYAEDSDLCLRARQLGMASGMVPQARMAHKVSSSFKPGSALIYYYANRNSLFLLKRHALGLGFVTRLLFVVLVCGKRMAQALLSGHLDSALALKDALRDYLNRRMGPW